MSSKVFNVFVLSFFAAVHQGLLAASVLQAPSPICQKMGTDDLVANFLRQEHPDFKPSPNISKPLAPSF
jgi:hypothetical protein